MDSFFIWWYIFLGGQILNGLRFSYYVLGSIVYILREGTVRGWLFLNAKETRIADIKPIRVMDDFELYGWPIIHLLLVPWKSHMYALYFDAQNNGRIGKTNFSINLRSRDTIIDV